MRIPAASFNETRDDRATLIRLSAMNGRLLRSKEEQAALVRCLRGSRSQATRARVPFGQILGLVAEAEASSHANPIDSELPRQTVAADRASRDELRGKARAARSAELHIERLARDIKTLEREIESLRTDLSPLGHVTYFALVRASRLPLVAMLTDGACSGCHMRVPSALVGSILNKGGIQKCPSCDRVLLAPEVELRPTF
jgi:hypothetical protein